MSAVRQWRWRVYVPTAELVAGVWFVTMGGLAAIIGGMFLAGFASVVLR